MGIGTFLPFYLDSFELLKWQKNHVNKEVPKWYNDFAFHIGNHVGICMLAWVRKSTRNFKWVLGISGNLMAKSKLPPCSGSVVLRQLNPINKKGSWSCYKWFWLGNKLNLQWKIQSIECNFQQSTVCKTSELFHPQTQL